MIRHVVMFRWNEGVDARHIAATTEEFATLPLSIPQIRSYAWGPDLGVAPANFDYAVTGEFDSVDDFLRYRDHPAHQALVQRFISPHVSDRIAVQFTVS
jgi:hypothetical protein